MLLSDNLILKKPSLLVTDLIFAPFTAIVTPGNTSPVSSVTFPVIVICASFVATKGNTIGMDGVIMSSPLLRLFKTIRSSITS